MRDINPQLYQKLLDRRPEVSELELLLELDLLIQRSTAIALANNPEDETSTAKTYATSMRDINQRLSNLGYQQFETHERMNKALDLFAGELPLNQFIKWIKIYQKLRAEVWKETDVYTVVIAQ